MQFIARINEDSSLPDSRIFNLAHPCNLSIKSPSRTSRRRCASRAGPSWSRIDCFQSEAMMRPVAYNQASMGACRPPAVSSTITFHPMTKASTGIATFNPAVTQTLRAGRRNRPRTLLMIIQYTHKRRRKNEKEKRCLEG